jgi:hypothetical protein
LVEDGRVVFTIPQARALLLELMPAIAEFIELRADAAELARSLTPGGPPCSLGGPVELGRLRARLDDALGVIQGSGVELKGFAPLLMDFPATFEGEPVLVCWLEGDLGLSWYHRADLGFPGRRPLPFDA